MLLYFKSGNYLFFEIGLECQRVPGCYRINRAVPKRYEKGLTIGRTRNFIPPPWYEVGGGGWMEPLPGVSDMLRYFETILPLLESL